MVNHLRGAQHITHEVVHGPGRMALRGGSSGYGLGEFVALQLPVGQGRQLFALFQFIVHGIHLSVTPYQRLPDCLSSKGLTRCEMASRARKIRERTVPMGQSMAAAISS